MWSYTDKMLKRAEISLALDQAFSIAGAIITPLKAPLSAVASGAISAGSQVGQIGLKYGVQKAGTGSQASSSQQGSQQYDAYKVNLAFLDYLASVDLSSGDNKHEKVLIQELGSGNSIRYSQTQVQTIATSLLYGVEV